MATDPSETADYTWEVLGMAHCMLWRFQDGQSVTAMAEHYGMAISAVEWWLRIALMPAPFPPDDSRTRVFTKPVGIGERLEAEARWRKGERGCNP